MITKQVIAIDTMAATDILCICGLCVRESRRKPTCETW